MITEEAVENLVVALALAITALALVIIAGKIKVPYPIVLVLGGTALGFIPSLTRIQLQPAIIFLVVLPPLFFESSWRTSWRDIRIHLRPILLQAIGLVVFTTCLVAVIAHALIPDLPWGLAFVLGAVVSPTDDVTTRAIAQRIGLPNRITSILGGETLINDAAGVTIYRLAVAAVASGTFSLVNAGAEFLLTSAGSVILGLIIGWLVILILCLVARDQLIANAVLLLTPFVVTLAAEILHTSSILAVVTAGLYMSWQSSKVLSSATRQQGTELWEVLAFVLNGFVFIFIGLELREILAKLSSTEPTRLVWYAFMICAAVIVIRIVWVVPSAFLPRLLSPRDRKQVATTPKEVTVIAWAGMRGVISLATAYTMPYGAGFEQREVVIFLTFAVILVTLVLQGLTLPPLIQFLDLPRSDTDREETRARLEAAKAGKARLNSLADEGRLDQEDELFTTLNTTYEAEINRLDAKLSGNSDESAEARARKVSAVMWEVNNAERERVTTLHDENIINDEVRAKIERELDFQELLHQPERAGGA